MASLSDAVCELAARDIARWRDLGQHLNVTLLSTPEGDDKPLKYPHMFAASDLMLVNKIDLLPYVDFDVDRLTDLHRADGGHGTRHR